MASLQIIGPAVVCHGFLNVDKHYRLLSIFFFYVAPVSPPQNVMISGMTATSVNLTWQELPVQDRNGDIIRYEVYYIPLEDFGGAIGPAITNVSGSELSASLDGLEENVNYSISIRAYTSAGEGPASQEVYALTNEDSKTLL